MTGNNRIANVKRLQIRGGGASVFSPISRFSKGSHLPLLPHAEGETSVCPICGKACGNKGMLSMHMRSPGKGYRAKHKLSLGMKVNARWP